MMENYTSFIHFKKDLQNAIEAATQRAEQQKRLLQGQVKAFPHVIKKEALRKTLPWIIGVGTAVVAVLLIRKCIRRPDADTVATEQPVAKPKIGKMESLATKLLPFAVIALKSWLNKKKQ